MAKFIQQSGIQRWQSYSHLANRTLLNSDGLQLQYVMIEPKRLRSFVVRQGFIVIYVLCGSGHIVLPDRTIHLTSGLTLSFEGCDLLFQLYGIESLQLYVFSTMIDEVQAVPRQRGHLVRLHQLPPGTFLEQIKMRTVDVGLMATDSISNEVIHHRLRQDKFWLISPNDFPCTEGLIILSGSLKMERDEEQTIMGQGDTFSLINPITYTRFSALEDTNFIYFSSQLMFHRYDILTQRYMDLAVEVELRDGYAADRCPRIAFLCNVIGKELGLDLEALTALHQAAFYHDIGKLKVPVEILQKPGPLTEDEWAIVKRHPIYGAEMMHEITNPSVRRITPLILQHHERIDGTGYPQGLKGDEITLGARIIAVVDAYDAMTHDRSYAKARTKEAALAELQRYAGTWYDANIVDLLPKLLKRHGL